jgi:hypothetical protein
MKDRKESLEKQDEGCNLINRGCKGLNARRSERNPSVRE